MPNFFLRYKKTITILSLILLISAFGIFVFGVGEARAAWPLGAFVDFTFEVIAKIIAGIGVIFKSIAGLFFYLASMLLEMSFGLEKFTNAGVVQVGWKITRDVANMLFVIGLIIIAGATALRIESYDIKKLLPKLIIAVLLINFSLVIAGVIIDFTQVGTHFFYEETKGDLGFSTRIAEILKISKMSELNPDAEIGKALARGTGGLMLLIFSIFLEIIFILAAAIAVALGAFFMIVRMITLWILLILAPMAWAMWVLPATEHLFQKWWSNFFKWAFFAPVYAFFIYLAIKASEEGAFTSIINSSVKNTVIASGWKQTIGSALLAAPDLLMQFLVIVGLLFGGVIVAQKIGVYGASGVIKMAKDAGKGAGDWGKRKALRAGARPAGAVGGWLASQGERMGWLGRGTGAAALVRQGGKGFRSIEEKERAAISTEIEKYKNYASGNLRTQHGAVDARGKVAIAKILAGRKDLSGIKDIEKTIGIAKRYGQEKDILGARPDLANSAEIGKYLSFTTDGLSKIQSESLGGDDPNDNQKALQKIIENSVTKRGGKIRASALPKLAGNSPDLYLHIKNNVIKKHMEDKKLRKEFEKERADMVKYAEGSAANALG